jgi:hypothetical protein
MREEASLMPTIEINQEHYDRLMAFKPVVEEALQEQMSDVQFADFIAFSAVERLFLESAMSGDLQLVEGVRKGDSVLQAAVATLRMAQLTLQGLSRQFPQEVFGFIANVWHGMNADERQDKGFGFHVLWERYKEQERRRS